MIVDENAEFRSYTANKLREEGFDVVLTTSDPKNALDAIEATSPDVVLFDLIMVGLDGIAFLEQAGKMPFAHRPRFIATSTAVNEMMIKEVMRLGASYFLVKPINYSILTERIHQICSVPERKEIFSVSQPEPTPEPRQVYIEDDLEKQVTESILEIGIPAHVKGYHYVRSAIMLAVTDPEAINAVTKIIYPTVAKQYKTSPSRVERAIRHAIEVAWDRGDVDVLNSIFGYSISSSRGKPTNSEFIAMIADRLRLRNKKRDIRRMTVCFLHKHIGLVFFSYQFITDSDCYPLSLLLCVRGCK